MSLNRYEQNLIFWQLLLYGVHIGHRFRNSSLYSGWFVFTYTYKTLIINLYKTILGFKNGNVGYDYCTRVGSPIWFLNLNKAYDIYTNESALRCGEFAYSTYWIHGMISNWLFLADQINQLWHYTEDAHKGQFKKLEMDYSPWFLSRWSWPRSVLISSVHTSEWPSHECLVSRTASVGICDTNISGHISNIATPGNDDSLDSIVYYNTNSSQYILEKKYGNITGWLHKVRTIKRNINFSEWVLRYYLDKKKLGLELHKLKLITNIRNREKKNKMTDYLYNVVRFNINVTNYWGLGVKFFFSLGSGITKFQGSLDLYSPNNQEDNKWITYGLMEKFKKRGFFICKILNYYLLRRVWARTSSFVVRKKYMSNKWFKFRFLTCAYYKKEWFDDYYRTNFLANRFWRNRIFKTFFRWSGFRRSKFAMKFFKFYNVYRYYNKRGFLDLFSSSFLNSSSFAKVAFSLGFGYFKRHFYNSLINKDNNLNHLTVINKKSDMGKWLFFKKAILNDLNKILNSWIINKYQKYSSLYKIYALLKYKLKKYVYIIYCYINFYFTFRFHNKLEYRILKRTRKIRLTLLFRALKNLCKFPKLVDFYNNSAFPYQRFQLWFLKNFISVGTNELFNMNVSKIFSMLTFNYRKRYFSYFLKHRYKKVKAFKKYFKKLKKWNNKANYRNWVIDTLDYKYNKFKDTEQVRRIVKNLHRSIRINYPAKHYSDTYKIKLNNKSSYSQVFNLASKYKNRLASRLLNYDALKYNIRHFNFYQISKKFYGKKILKDWNRATSHWINEDKWLIDDKNDTETPSWFFELMYKSKNPTNNMVSGHNLPYFNKIIINTTFYNILKKIKHLENLEFWKKIKSKGRGNIFFKRKIYKNKKLLKFIEKHSKSIRVLKYQYRAHIRRIGKKKTRYLTGGNLFDNLKFIKFWQIIKKKFFIEKGFDVKIWELNFNKNLIKRNFGLKKMLYFHNNSLINYAYFFFLDLLIFIVNN